ncbi:MAG: hypothetical protein U5K76_02940 [Woeseiaceae bacterium]|nr:hypothetical protein [Woeseiaceae bacterium]
MTIARPVPLAKRAAITLMFGKGVPHALSAVALLGSRHNMPSTCAQAPHHRAPHAGD